MRSSIVVCGSISVLLLAQVAGSAQQSDSDRVYGAAQQPGSGQQPGAGQKPYEIEMQKQMAAEKVRQAGLVTQEQQLLTKVEMGASQGAHSLDYANLLQQLAENYYGQYKFPKAKPRSEEH